MTKKSMILGVAALAVAGSIFVPRALAYRGDPNIQGSNYTKERHEAMEKAFETNNYTAWKNLMGDRASRRVTQVVNAQNFAKFAKAHNLAQQGKVAEAKAVRTELGLGLGNKQGNGKGQYSNK